MVYDIAFTRVLTRIDPERAHQAAIRAIGALAPLSRRIYRSPRAPRTVMGIRFPNAFGLAAGFDKNAIAVPGLLALGFGHVEVGTVTAQAQPGNPRPRLSRLPADRAIVNRMGFNNDGAAVVASRLHRLRRRIGYGPVIGVNIGKSKVTPPEQAADDYAESARLLAPYASYLVINVSSPNTPGLRDLQAVDQLLPIVEVTRSAADSATMTTSGRRIPLVLKIAPDLADADIDNIVDTALVLGIDGLCAANTTTGRPAELHSTHEQIRAAGDGGLSGPILAERAASMIRRIRSRAGDRMALIGVGGVETPADVRDRLSCGADLVQGYAGFIYHGPAWPSSLAAAAA